jgi:hypothetical protein
VYHRVIGKKDLPRREKQMSDLPERINVMKVVTYDVQNIMESIVSMNTDKDFDDITLEEVMEQVEAWVEDDFPTERVKDLIFQDENGEDL